MDRRQKIMQQFLQLWVNWVCFFLVFLNYIWPKTKWDICKHSQTDEVMESVWTKVFLVLSCQHVVKYRETLTQRILVRHVKYSRLLALNATHTRKWPKIVTPFGHRDKTQQQNIHTKGCNFVPFVCDPLIQSLKHLVPPYWQNTPNNTPNPLCKFLLTTASGRCI